MARTTPGNLSPYPQQPRPLRIVAAGTLFLTHTLALPAYPEPASSTRAHAYTRTRNGSACTVLTMLAQLRSRGIEKCLLVASLGGNADGREVVRDLESAGVSTKYCKVWEGVGVPGAWILHAANTGSQTVINHNPLPDITHEEFVSLLGPLLAPENYPPPTLEAPSPAPPSPRPSLSLPGPTSHPPAPIDPNAPPFDWLHFEGRSVRTTLHNIMGVDGLARERKWRSQCVFSLDVGRRAKQGVEALIPHADVLFLNKHYAQAHSPAYASTPRAFLLSLTALAPPHALLVAYWGAEGAAALSVPTREYFQSSGWAEDPPPSAASSAALSVAPSGGPGGTDGPRPESKAEELLSVRSGSDFWAAPGRTSSTLSAFSAALLSSGHGHSASGSGSGSGSGPGLVGSEQGHGGNGNGNGNGHGGVGHGGAGRIVGRGRGRGHMRGRGEPLARQDEESDESDADSEGTEIAGSSDTGAAKGKGKTTPAVAVDEVGAQDAFVAGMIYALSRRLLPGAPYSPGLAGVERTEDDRRWRLDECLRFATELAGRKARKRGWEGLADELARGGWFDA